MWKLLNNTWVISDTHFNHRTMIEKKIRPKDYQERTIREWKRLVKDTDIIIHLWDVIFDRPSELKGILADLPGYKILVKGNHDKNKTQWYIDKGFNEVHDSYTIRLRNRKQVTLIHKPSAIKDCDIEVNGHLHNYKGNNIFRHKEYLTLTEKNRIYSLELENYQPILLSSIVSEYHQSCKYIKLNSTFKRRMKYYIHQGKKILTKKRKLIFTNP